MSDPTAPTLSADELTQAIHDAFDIVQHDPARRKANFSGLTGIRNNLMDFAAADESGAITCVQFGASHTCTRDAHQIQALRHHVLALWANNLASEHATALATITVRCFPDNIEDYLAVELAWVTPLLPVET